MPAARILQITNAEVRFGPAPAAGTPVDPVTLTDYACQVFRSEITATSNNTTQTVNHTFCNPGSEITVPVASSFDLNIEFYQDWNAPAAVGPPAVAIAGLSGFLFKNDATKVAFAMYLDGADDPAATGIVTASAGAFGGTAGEPLTASVTLPIDGYPDITDASGASLRTDTTTMVTAETSSSITVDTADSETVAA